MGVEEAGDVSDERVREYVIRKTLELIRDEDVIGLGLMVFSCLRQISQVNELRQLEQEKDVKEVGQTRA